MVYEKSDDGISKNQDMVGILSSPNLSEEYQINLVAQGPGSEDNTVRYMGEVSLVSPGEYLVKVAAQTQNLLVEQRADNLSFLREFGVFFIGTSILLVVVFCWAMVSKRKRISTTV